MEGGVEHTRLSANVYRRHSCDTLAQSLRPDALFQILGEAFDAHPPGAHITAEDRQRASLLGSIMI